MTDDLLSRRARVLDGTSSAGAEIERSLQHAASAAVAPAFLKIDAVGARAAARAVDAAFSSGAPLPPLAGLAVSIKDLFDIAGQVTTAGSTVLADAEPAAQDAPAVSRLRAAGAALIGRTHMTEFAFSGIGLNPHHPTPANVPMAALDRDTPRIPGGSSSGAAVSVAGGAAWAALGSDTGGSVRIPAALQGLVGFKNTASLTPTEGAIPLSTTLDTVSALTRSVRDAVLLHELLSARRVALPGRPLRATRLAVPTTLMLDALEPAVAAAFERAVDRLSRVGAQIVTLDVPPLADLAPLQVNGGFASCESWAWHRHRLATHEEAGYDRRVVTRIRRGMAMSAADYIDLQKARAAWIARMHVALRGFDAVLSPTVPILAPPITALEASDEEFFRVNSLLLRNPSVVNLLDGCAISLPCQAPGEAPVGLMLWSRGHADDALLDTALAVEAVLATGASS
ncbi:amidase [Methylibium sp. Pch-M]|uniref:amidase n=1 Tax=Methylibium sp. Pch-M TaxID=2082386 RepID=UPI001013682F|nr:amidase [Methylibium sp. Pch-M]QAZ41108.1 amidase [Methylibium sp. Pch-M]